jgi:hypothetical protein
MAAPLSAHEQPIAKIFGGDYVFHIPGFQRPYSWTTEQARDLLEDFLTFMNDDDPGDTQRPFFLGSIVLTKPENNPHSHVIDGQHTLGNLALLTRKKNASASNWEFDRKKTSYFARGGVSPFPITTQVLEHKDWTPKVVAARQKELCDKLETHWRLQDRKAA